MHGTFKLFQLCQDLAMLSMTHTILSTVQIQISWLLTNPADQNQQCHPLHVAIEYTIKCNPTTELLGNLKWMPGSG